MIYSNARMDLFSRSVVRSKRFTFAASHTFLVFCKVGFRCAQICTLRCGTN